VHDNGFEVGGVLLEAGRRKGGRDHTYLQGPTMYDSKYRIYIKLICPWGYSGSNITLQDDRHFAVGNYCSSTTH
jgi:hypothetical protein